MPRNIIYDMPRTPVFIGICLTIIFVTMSGHLLSQTALQTKANVKVNLNKMVFGPDTAKPSHSFSIMPSLTMAQNGFSESWQGGLRSFNFKSALRAEYNYRGRRKIFFSYFEGAYARGWDQLTADGEYKKIKKEDRFVFSNNFGYKMGNKTNFAWAAMVDLKSQFDHGYADEKTRLKLVSSFFSPAYLIGSLGIRYDSPKGLSIVGSPLSGRVIFVMDDSLVYKGYVGGVKPGEKVTFQSGAYMDIAYERRLTQKVYFRSKLELFSNYMFHAENIDVDWSTNIDCKLNNFFSIFGFFRLVYRDQDRYTVVENGVSYLRGPHIQWNESLNIGLAYRFTKQ